jgi:hypothetical protein
MPTLPYGSHSLFPINTTQYDTNEANMSKQRMRALALLALVASFCVIATILSNAQDVRTNYMPGTDFSKYKSYRWGAIEGGAHPNQILDAEIRSAVDSQLATKGLSKTDGDKSDLVVTYQTAVDKEKQWNSFGGGGLRWGGMGTATSSVITVGTIVLDFYDPAAKELVWQGHAAKAVDTNSNQEKSQKNLDKTMRKLLKDFPPKKKLALARP